MDLEILQRYLLTENPEESKIALRTQIFAGAQP